MQGIEYANMIYYLLDCVTHDIDFDLNGDRNERDKIQRKRQLWKLDLWRLDNFTKWFN